MNSRTKITLFALALTVALVPLAACSQKGNSAQTSSAASAGNASDPSATRLVGKVTAVVGNQVTLAVGTLNETRGGGWHRASSSADSSAAASSGVSSGTASSGSPSSSLITLTGETQTVLIPVGLTLSQGGETGGMRGGPQGWGQSGSSGGQSGGQMPGGGQAPAGGGQTPAGGGQMQTGGAAGRTSGSARSRSSGSTATTTKKSSSDFSSIKKGMILQITEKMQSDGTAAITAVRVISEST